MPPPKSSSRMTANPVKPSRYRPGKPLADEKDSSSGEEAEVDEVSDSNKAPSSRVPPPKATSFPTDAAKKVTSNLRNVDLGQRRRQAEAEEKAKKEREWREKQQLEREAGFVTESDSDSEDEDEASSEDAYTRKQPTDQKPSQTAGSSSEASDSSAEDSDSDSSDSSAAPRKQLRPVFIPKNQRNKSVNTAAAAEAAAAAKAEAEAARRAAETDALVQERLERDAMARAAGKKSWDDDEPDEQDEVDDTDGLDPELEHAQWVARELSRLKRARAALEEREAEIAEVERRKALSTPEREAEDREYIERQAEERKDRGKANFMQRYHHKGAFYHDEDSEGKGLLQRDLMGATYESGHSMKEALPQYLQVRDETMIGRKGRTKYRDMKTEDTGRWGDYSNDRRRPGGPRDERGASSYTADDRFRPDFDTKGPSGANASALGERKRAHEDSRRDDAKRPRREDAVS